MRRDVTRRSRLSRCPTLRLVRNAGGGVMTPAGRAANSVAPRSVRSAHGRSPSVCSPHASYQGDDVRAAYQEREEDERRADDGRDARDHHPRVDHLPPPHHPHQPYTTPPRVRNVGGGGRTDRAPRQHQTPHATVQRGAADVIVDGSSPSSTRMTMPTRRAASFRRQQTHLPPVTEARDCRGGRVPPSRGNAHHRPRPSVRRACVPATRAMKRKVHARVWFSNQ